MARWLTRILDQSVPLETYKPEADDWRRCLVGEVTKDFGIQFIQPRFLGLSSPRDGVLEDLGTDFASAVRKGQRTKALRLHDAVYARVRTLVKKALKK